MAVFNDPCFPMAMEQEEASSSSSLSTSIDCDMDKFVEQFLSGIPGVPTMTGQTDHLGSSTTMWLHQPPQQPMLDRFPYEEVPGSEGPTEAQLVVQKETQSGFLDIWGQQEQATPDGLLELDGEEMETDRCSPEEKREYSSLVKEELHCHIKLKLLREGRDIGSEVTDNQTGAKECEISDETREMQKKRREKNREAAKKCRQKKRASEREQELKIRQAESEVRELQAQLERERRDFSSLLEHFPNVPCFLAYLRLNRHLLKNPAMKAAMQQFVKSHGGHMLGGIGERCAACPSSQHPGMSHRLPGQQ